MRNAINSRKEECADLEGKISNILSQSSDGSTLSEKLQKLEKLQLRRLQLQAQKQQLKKQNEELQMYIDTESQKLLKNVQEMERVQKNQMKEVLDKSVKVMEITEQLEQQHESLQKKVNQLKMELINQLKRIYSIQQRPDEQLTQPLLLLNGITIPTKIGNQDLELMNEVYGDVSHIVNLLARYFNISLKYPLHPNAMYSMVSIRGKEQTKYPLYSKTLTQQAYKTALTFLNYDIDQLLLFFGNEKYEAAAHAQPVEKVYAAYKYCDEYFCPEKSVPPTKTTETNPASVEPVSERSTQ